MVVEGGTGDEADWKDGVSAPFVWAAATLVAATDAFWLAAAIRYALEARLGRRDAVTHTR